MDRYEKDVLVIHRILTGVDILYRDVLQLQRKLDVLEILMDALKRVGELKAADVARERALLG